MLGFQAKTITSLVDLAAFPGNRAVEEIAGVELHTGLSGPNFHHASGRVLNYCRHLL